MEKRRRGLWREPLLHFLIAGAALYAVDRATAEPETDSNAIIIAPELIATFREQHEARLGAPPDDEAIESMVAEYVREEALYREALSLGLDRGDSILRQRLVQKMEYLLQGTAQVDEVNAPTDDTLNAWLHAHAADYELAATTTFTHIFFARVRTGDDAITAANAVLAELQAMPDPPERAPQRGDPFARGYDFRARTDRQINGAFGSTFLEGLAEAQLGRWSGPIESRFGQHLVFVSERTETRLPSLDEIRGELTNDWLSGQTDQAYESSLEELLARYQVERRDQAGETP